VIYFQSSTYEYPFFPTSFFEEATFSPKYVFGTFVNSRHTWLCGVMSGSCILFHGLSRSVLVFFFVPSYHYCFGPVAQFEAMCCGNSSVVILFKIAFAI
jgi:hypothetical protein